MATHNEFTEDDWTPEERALFASLPSERIPPSELKTRTIDAVLRHAAPARRPIASRRRAFLLAAASSLIFIAGAFVGYAAARRSLHPVNESRMATTRQEVARAGSESSSANPTGTGLNTSTTTNSQPTRHVVWY